MTVFVVVCRSMEHAPDPIYSFWASRSDAETECERLGFDALEVVEVELNTPSDFPIL